MCSNRAVNDAPWEDEVCKAIAGRSRQRAISLARSARPGDGPVRVEKNQARSASWATKRAAARCQLARLASAVRRRMSLG